MPSSIAGNDGTILEWDEAATLIFLWTRTRLSAKTSTYDPRQQRDEQCAGYDRVLLPAETKSADAPPSRLGAEGIRLARCAADDITAP